MTSPLLSAPLSSGDETPPPGPEAVFHWCACQKIRSADAARRAPLRPIHPLLFFLPLKLGQTMPYHHCCWWSRDSRALGLTEHEDCAGIPAKSARGSAWGVGVRGTIDWGGDEETGGDNFLDTYPHTYLGIYFLTPEPVVLYSIYLYSSPFLARLLFISLFRYHLGSQLLNAHHFHFRLDIPGETVPLAPSSPIAVSGSPSQPTYQRDRQSLPRPTSCIALTTYTVNTLTHLLALQTTYPQNANRPSPHLQSSPPSAQ